MTSQPVDAAFEQLVKPYELELRRYCGRLAGSGWDGEDLFQETMIKAFRRFQKWPERALSRAYMYRIAANAWFDICRRRKIAFLPEVLADQAELSYVSDWNRDDVRDSLEMLMDRLEPRQAALIVLTDVFGFTPAETASVLGQPATAIKSALHRARTRLKKAADRQLHLWKDADDNREAQADKADAALLEAFLKAFRSADAPAMFRSYRELAGAGIKINRVRFMAGRAWFSFKDPDGNVLTVASPLIRERGGNLE
ncbi:RNA polymerase sigma factor [Paenibacillus sp. NEAU-GSW1]|uniref:RNA polymerase sigma factor n=1 Tax=Paenibacillus sp. NEAU-GSW1 TaxID=2682486 RepID=UPI0012E262F1|nr:RNA polymerase sigma factor [Paenibacillus sp. NEAU-GSW1]MUT64637.1 sigma-70 family RNA polymerase sigma factor [Paenibacillus sp. NEAU-GSW1]